MVRKGSPVRVRHWAFPPIARFQAPVRSDVPDSTVYRGRDATKGFWRQLRQFGAIGHADFGYSERVKTDYDVVCAFLAQEKASGQRLQAEVRVGRSTTDPRSGEAVEGMQTGVLWCEDQPVAALVGSVVLVNRAARFQDHRKLVAEEAARRGHDVQHVREPDLWRLAA